MRYSCLAIMLAPYISGAEISFIEYLKYVREFNYIIILPRNACDYWTNIPSNHKIIHLPLMQLKKSLNPFYYFSLTIHLLCNIFKINSIIKKEGIKTIYSNNYKSFIYSLIISFFSFHLKKVCHLRDVISNNLINKIFLKFANKIICISKYIYDQVPVSDSKKKLIYNGIDVEFWISQDDNYKNIKKELGITQNTILIAQIAQITPWKNHLDFIKSAEAILSYEFNIHFLIIGSPFNKKDQKLQLKLEKEIYERGLSRHFTLMKFREGIKEIMNQIDILIHPSINEPFGRVIIEAMILEKAIVAYNCCGPAEIINNGRTGYLAKPFNVFDLTQKTLTLLKDQELRKCMGKEARQKAIKEYNMKNTVTNLNRIIFNQI